MSLAVFVCTGCGRAVFPRRLLCPDCGGADWREEAVEHGVLEAVTERDARVGAVRTPQGPLAVARVESGAQVGSSVALDQDGDVPVAR